MSLLAATIGPTVLEIVFNAEIGRRTLTLLALGSATYMVALGIAQAVIALHGHAWAAIGWVAGLVTFVIVTLVSSEDLLLRVELGLGRRLRRGDGHVSPLHLRLQSGAEVDPTSIIDAITDHPLEAP